MSNSTQEAAILEYLMTGAELGPMEALTRFGTMRLAARIHELRQAINIESVRVKLRSGKHIVKYRIAK